jgi:hypothetical protein
VKEAWCAAPAWLMDNSPGSGLGYNSGPFLLRTTTTNPKLVFSMTTAPFALISAIRYDPTLRSHKYSYGDFWLLDLHFNRLKEAIVAHGWSLSLELQQLQDVCALAVKRAVMATDGNITAPMKVLEFNDFCHP